MKLKLNEKEISILHEKEMKLIRGGKIVCGCFCSGTNADKEADFNADTTSANPPINPNPEPLPNL